MFFFVKGLFSQPLFQSMVRFIMKGQLSLFTPDFIRDMDCTKDTPIMYGKKDYPIYVTGAKIKPSLPGRNDSEH